jgi:glutaredoxin
MKLVLTILSFVLLSCLVLGCEQEPAEETGPVEAVPKAQELPPLDLRDDTAGLLLTYVDEKGDFQVVRKIADVPEARRDAVRVVVDTKVAGTKNLVYVADLRKKQPNGAYAVTTMTRAQWVEKGARLRKTRMEALAPSASPPPSASSPSQAETAPPVVKIPPNGQKIVAIIYGAHWCKPCHDAAAYLRARGVTVVEKDVDDSEVAKREMQQKLARAGRGGASIPVIDVMGQLLIGYSPQALSQAIENARGTTTL